MDKSKVRFKCLGVFALLLFILPQVVMAQSILLFDEADHPNKVTAIHRGDNGSAQMISNVHYSRDTSLQITAGQVDSGGGIAFAKDASVDITPFIKEGYLSFCLRMVGFNKGDYAVYLTDEVGRELEAAVRLQFPAEGAEWIKAGIPISKFVGNADPTAIAQISVVATDISRTFWVDLISLCVELPPGFIVGTDLLELTPWRSEEGTRTKVGTREKMSVLDMLRSGRPIIDLIGLCSLVALYLIINNFMLLRFRKMVPIPFLEEVEGYIKDGKVEKAITLCRGNPGHASRILREGLSKYEASAKIIADAKETSPHLKFVAIESVERAVQEAGNREGSNLNRDLSYLSLISSVAPLLGLLGTVIGMITAFNVIAMEQGLGRPAMLAEGISMALITTACGLTVAIPTIAFYFYFRHKTHRIISCIEDRVMGIIEKVI